MSRDIIKANQAYTISLQLLGTTVSEFHGLGGPGPICALLPALWQINTAQALLSITQQQRSQHRQVLCL